jgi:putative transposase
MRALRVKINGAAYHIVIKVNNGAIVFKDYPEASLLFLQYAERALKKYDFSLINFCIMDNHVHFLLEPGEGEDLSRIMQWLLGCFAQEWNRRKNRTGHFWNGRFWSRPITSDEDLANVFNYISQNPVKAGEAKEPKDWVFSGAYCYHNGIKGRKTGIFRIIKPGKRICLYQRLFYGH